MRMWMVDPKLLCTKHLLGEHGEIHKHRHNFMKQHRITKRISPVVQIEPMQMEARHNELAAELIRRKYNHNSLKDLINRCPECANRINNNNTLSCTSQH